MRTLHYILHHGLPVAEPDVLRWARWFETHTEERVVARDELPGGVTVSTVFLGLDHNFMQDGPPILYETMIFGGALDEDQDRYHTLDEAEVGHAAMLARAREVL